MDKETLVKSDIEIGGLIFDALSHAKMPVTLCDWRYVPEVEEWQLVIATPWYGKHGPHDTYLRLIEALQRAGIYEEVPMRRVFLVSPNDPIVQEMEKEIQTRAEGFIHLIRHADRQRDSYSVIFAPISGPGGAVPAKHFSGLQALRDFLISPAAPEEQFRGRRYRRDRRQRERFDFSCSSHAATGERTQFGIAKKCVPIVCPDFGNPRVLRFVRSRGISKLFIINTQSRFESRLRHD